MFEVQNGVYKSIWMDWDNITLPLKAASPVSADGVVANNNQAIGLVPQTVTVRPVIPELYILVAGDVSGAEAEATYGTPYTDEAIEAMDGIRFMDYNGSSAMNIPERVSAIEATEDDMVIRFVYDETAEEYAAKIVKGSYADIANKIDNSFPFTIKFHYGVMLDATHEDEYIAFSYVAPSIDDDAVVWTASTIYILPDGTITNEEPSSDDDT